MLNDSLNYVNKRRFIGALVLLAAIIIAEVVLTIYIPVWREYFYNILQAKDALNFNSAVGYFAMLMGGIGAVQGVKLWVSQLVSFQARSAIGKCLLDKWVKKGNKELPGHGVAMTDSLSISTTLWLQVWMEVVISALILIGLVLANLHQPVVIGGAALFTVVVSVAAILFKRPLIRTDKDRQIAEGEFREAIARVKEGGKESIINRLRELTTAYYKAVRVVMFYTLFSSVKGSMSTIIPYLFMSAAYFAGSITLGQFMAIVSTFELFVVNATILLIKYTDLIKAKAAQTIVSDFNRAIEEHDEQTTK